MRILTLMHRIGISIVGLILLLFGAGMALADVATSTNATSTAQAITTSITEPVATTTLISSDTQTTASTTELMSTSSPDISSATSSTKVATPSSATSTPILTPTGAIVESSPIASSTPVELLTCTMAYTATLYDTPSGHLDAGYVIATSASTSQLVAHILGTQAWTDCHDSKGRVYEFTLTPEEYSSLSQPNISMPFKYAAISSN